MSMSSVTRLLAQRGAQLVVVVLIIAIALDSALILTRALSNDEGVPPAPTVGALPFGARSHNPQLVLATVINGHLFGAAATMGVADAPPTSMPLILTGVIADKNHPNQGQAIIGDNAADAKLYAVGSALSGGAHLHAVYSDRVLIERNGHLETLMLPRTALPGASTYLSPAPSARTASQATNPSVLAGLISVQPVFSQGKLTGYRIFPGPHGAHAFEQLGLRPGDLVLAINGTSLDDPTQALQVLQTLSSSGSATVTVSRNGTPQEVNLNLAEISSEEQQAAGAAPGNPAPPSPIGPTIRRRHFGLPPANVEGSGGIGQIPAAGLRASEGAALTVD
jgi:general secretion pathway protein C